MPKGILYRVYGDPIGSQEKHQTRQSESKLMKLLLTAILMSFASMASAVTHEIQCTGIDTTVYYADFENKDPKVIDSTRKDFKFYINKVSSNRYEILNPGHIEASAWQETRKHSGERWYFRDGSRPDIRHITEGKEFVYGINDWNEELTGSDDKHEIFVGCRWTTL